MLCTDMLVPKDHLLRKIDAAVDFRHIYELVEDLYCEDNGRPSCDPVVLFKLVLIQHLFGIRSLRQTHAGRRSERGVSLVSGIYACRSRLPHFATISYAFWHRFTAEVIEGVFRWILEEVAPGGISVAGGGVCGRNAHQGEREPEEAREEGRFPWRRSGIRSSWTRRSMRIVQRTGRSR